MNREKYIVLLDPSIKDNKGTPSDNLGDCIIYDSVTRILNELFTNHEIIRISIHQDFTKREKEIINNAMHTIVGGTNILTSNIRHFPRMSPTKVKGFYLFPGFKNLILLGAGWSSYEGTPDWATRIFYRKILSRRYLHSLRDTYTFDKLKTTGFTNILNTSCPTTWNLNPGISNKFNSSFGKILFMLTNYQADPVCDSNLLDFIFDTGIQEIYFFPQSALDSAYLVSLPAYQKNDRKIHILDHCLSSLEELLTTTRLNYIGNRLHGGIKCLEHKHPSIIIGIDNRAVEIGKSIGLNVTERNDLRLLQNWVKNEYTPPPLSLPLNEIKQWKNQFKQDF